MTSEAPFNSEVWQSSALSEPGKVLDLAGRAGWRQRAPLTDNGRQCLLGSVCIHKALGNPVGGKGVFDEHKSLLGPQRLRPFGQGDLGSTPSPQGSLEIFGIYGMISYNNGCVSLF